MDHGMYAAELFLGGYNCAQSMMVAYCDLTGLKPDYAANRKLCADYVCLRRYGDGCFG